MISIYLVVFITLNVVEHSQSLQSGYTCDSSVTLTCPQSRRIVILEVTYSSECPNLNDVQNDTSIYAPSRCIAYYRERTSTLCNGLQICIVANNLDQRPSFLPGKQANCAFKGQSINIEYSCVPDFHSSKLPRIDICSLQLLDDIKEGFIHTPNYPKDYSNSLTCSKTIPALESSHRLKIYALEFDVESISVTRPSNVIQVNDWLEINENGEKLYGTKLPFTLLFDDVIEASLIFKSNSVNTKRTYNGFLLYFIVTPIRRPRTLITTKMTTASAEILEIPFDDESTSLIEPKTAALVGDYRRRNNTGLILLVVLLSGLLFVILTAFLLYKRRNDRRVRYIIETFKSTSFNQQKSLENPDETQSKPKLHYSLIADDRKLITKPVQNANSDNIYSRDPLLQKSNNNSYEYEYIDPKQLELDDVIYETIHSNDQQIYGISKGNIV